MGVTSIIVVFVIVWWCVFFMALPWGNRPTADPEPGHVESAPAKPRLWLKAGITTAVAAVLTVGIFFAIDAELISFREMARE